ncbi:MAG: hypothetical protein AAFX05_09120 [Planctomycetota bacterium]
MSTQLAGMTVVLSCAACAHGAMLSGTPLIGPDTRNGSFEADSIALEEPSDFSGMDGITNWTLWEDLPREVGDGSSGVIQSPNASDGTMTLILQPVSGAVVNLTDYVVQEGDIFCYLWDGVFRFDMPWVLPTVSLVYQNDESVIVPIPGTETTRQTLDNPQLDIGLTWVAEPGSPVIGNRIGIGIDNHNSEKFPEFDNFRLSVVPTPGTSLPCAIAGAAAFRRRRV